MNNWDAGEWKRAAVIGSDGQRIGTVDDLYVDETGEPSFFAVNTGVFGLKTSFVPAHGAERVEDGLRVPYAKDTVTGAPRLDPDGQFSPDEEDELYRYYGLERAAVLGDEDYYRATDDAMTRSEEELIVGSERREVGRARLRKHVVTEPVQTSVAVTREEPRIEREPITADNLDAAVSGPELTESEHEVVLHEELPVVEKQVLPKERVRLRTEAVTEEHPVSETVAKEKIELDE